MLRNRSVFVVALTMLASACVHGDNVSSPDVKESEWNDTVQVRYLGVGGFFIRLGNDVVMTAPMYSNPSLLKEAGRPIYPDADAIRKLHFQNLNHEADLKDVKAILVGHAHYDHLMDVPHVWGFSAEKNVRPLILGNTTMQNVLKPYTVDGSSLTPPLNFRIASSRIIALNNPADDYVDSRNCAGADPSPDAKDPVSCPPFPGKKGRPYPIPDSRIRVRAFCGRHPAQFPPIHQGPGCLSRGLDDQPSRTSTDYLEGESLTYLIDFLDDQNRIRFRIYYQDVPSDGLFGRVPDDVLAEHQVDLALLCAGTWSLVEHNDADCIICNLKPEHVLIGHWEDFFKPQKPGGRATPAPLQQVGEFRKLVRTRMSEAGRDPANVLMPEPQVLRTYKVKPQPSVLR